HHHRTRDRLLEDSRRDGLVVPGDLAGQADVQRHELHGFASPLSSTSALTDASTSGSRRESSSAARRCPSPARYSGFVANDRKSLALRCRTSIAMSHRSWLGPTSNGPPLPRNRTSPPDASRNGRVCSM